MFSIILCALDSTAFILFENSPCLAALKRVDRIEELCRFNLI